MVARTKQTGQVSSADTPRRVLLSVIECHRGDDQLAAEQWKKAQLIFKRRGQHYIRWWSVSATYVAPVNELGSVLRHTPSLSALAETRRRVHASASTSLVERSN